MRPRMYPKALGLHLDRLGTTPCGDVRDNGFPEEPLDKHDEHPLTVGHRSGEKDHGGSEFLEAAFQPWCRGTQ